MKKTKILVIGDIHGDVSLVKRFAKKAERENVDLVILPGDLTFFEQSTKNLIGPFTKVGKPVLLLHGNHETLETSKRLSEMYPNVKNLHGYSLKKNNLGIFGAGGTPFGSSAEKKIFNVLKKGNEKVKGLDKKIMITHMHAANSMSEFSGFPGSDGIRKAIETFKPDLFIHAHIHEAEGIEEKIGKTRVVNVGRRGRIFEF